MIDEKELEKEIEEEEILTIEGIAINGKKKIKKIAFKFLYVFLLILSFTLVLIITNNLGMW